MWSAFLTWLGSLFTSKTATAASPSLSVGITSDVGEVAKVLSSGTALAAQIQSELNTQPMIDAKVRQEKQARLNAINLAIENGDLIALRKLSTP